MNRKKILIFNWKTNPESKKNALDIFSNIKKAQKFAEKNKIKIDFIVAPPSVFLDALNLKNSSKKIKFSAQNFYNKNFASVTGAISQSMLKDLGATYSIVGHWERRSIFSETNKEISKKIKSLIDLKMKAIVCVGEEQRDIKGKFVDFLKKQILETLDGVLKDDANKIILAYEPVWAIGKEGRRVTVEEIEQSVFLIKKILKGKFQENSEKVKIIYGGSVDDMNIKKLSEIFGVDGFLLGRSSLDSKIIMRMVRNLKK